MTRKREATTVQTLMFPAERYSDSEALSWAQSHDYKSAHIDTPEDGRYRHVRQIPPWHFHKGSLRTIVFGDGIKAVVGHIDDDWRKHKNDGGATHRVPAETAMLGHALDLEVEDDEQRWTFPFSPGQMVVLAPADAMDRSPGGGRLFLIRDARHNLEELDGGEYNAAARTYEGWTDGGHRANEVADLEVPNHFREKVGRAVRLDYRSDKFGRRGNFTDYTHEFSEPGPLVYYSDHPVEGYALVAGVFQVSPRGIVD